MAGGSTVEKTNLLFAAGDHYDMHPYGLRVWEVNRWAMEGHIVPLSDHWGRLGNYLKWWSPEAWQTVQDFNKAPDGKMYMLLSKNPRTISRGFVYRQDLVEDAGLEWPSTIAGYTELLKALKANNPDHYPLFTRGQGGIFTDVFYNTWRTSGNVHFDIDSGELVYGAGHRQDARVDQVLHHDLRRGADGRGVPHQHPRAGERDPVRGQHRHHHPQLDRQRLLHEQHFAQGHPGGHLDPLLCPLLAGPGAEAIINPEQVFYPWGPFLTNNSKGEKLDRLIDYLNWTMDGEGLVARYSVRRA